jgi:hypothetical protein
MSIARSGEFSLNSVGVTCVGDARMQWHWSSGALRLMMTLDQQIGGKTKGVFMVYD